VQSHLVVIGCGGNGAMFVTLAAHLGFRHFTLCDADSLDATNLNRYVIALPDQIGEPKVEIVRSYLTSRFADVLVECVQKPFPNEEIASAFRSASLIVGCVDNVHTRIEVDVLSRKHRRVLMDLGAGFTLDDTSGLPVAAGGQVLLSRPGGPCLMCHGFNVAAGQNTYSVPQPTAPEPSSLLLNSIVSALAAECLLREISGQAQEATRVAYDRDTLSVVVEAAYKRPGCKICGVDSEDHIASVAEGERWTSSLAAEYGARLSRVAD
jgi:hypothetical protein